MERLAYKFKDCPRCDNCNQRGRGCFGCKGCKECSPEVCNDYKSPDDCKKCFFCKKIV